MCGIAGFYGYRNDSLIKKISQQLYHRGPDGEGFYIDSLVTLLNRRLAIIDLKTGDQPIFNEKKTLIVVFNGEIYNYRELKDNLLKKGHQFSTNSDTEVIVHGYEQWGRLLFNQLNGMFAIALYDKVKKELILARDHFGIKPLYYAFPKKVIEKSSLIFSSEIKPIIESSLIEKQPNDRIIYRYLSFRIHDDQKETFFKNVYKLMPGELLSINEKGLKIDKYSEFPKRLFTQKEQELTNQNLKKFKELLIKAIKLRLIADVPVGTCLSGGLDSSTVVTIVNELLQDKVKEAKSLGENQKTFSAVFPGSINNEEQYVNLLTSQLKNISNYKIYPNANEFFSEIKNFILTQEEPTISTGPYAQYKVMEKVKDKVKVLLDGQGADEMMAGYLPYYFVYLRQLWENRKYQKLFYEIWQARDIIHKFLKEKLLTTFLLKENLKIQSLLNQQFVKENQSEKYIINTNNLKKRLAEDIFSNSLPALLRYEDRNSMRFSVEGRVPFLDKELLTYLFSLSDEAIIANGWNKAILRKVMKDYLPDLILTRRNKIGFTTPEQEWFLTMKNRIYQIFKSQSLAKRKYFNASEIILAFEKYLQGKINDSLIFWRILNLEIWLEVFFDHEKKIVENKKLPFLVNPGKSLAIDINGNKYYRFPLKTQLIKKNDNLKKIIFSNLKNYLERLTNENSKLPLIDKDWFLVISEKVIAITQGRSYLIKDIKPSFWAKNFSKFVRKTPFGIGLGSPWTMQLAIQEVGLLRIIFASTIAWITKPLGIKGLFYHLAGRQVASIDGPTEYSLYPSNVSAKLGPKDPQKEAKEIHKFLKTNLSFYYLKKFQGVAIIDANDLGQNILGNCSSIDNKTIEKIFSDNPMGQADEQTPVIIVFKIH